ncbi:multidrug effflux MFS transporter [Aliidiomarina taiwanensis]|uniref:multidrug effflux MFS transporter n=1 Tax=Aliidiomarina taiwanensis TaxID=946228 RepID=UPI001300A644|nr:multidrug effflux MFS transporter [Aliidiomarina taiwanensis]
MPFAVIILLASLSALVAAAIDMYLPAFPTVAEKLEISVGQVQQTLTVFLIGLGVGQAIYGPLLDRFGRKAPLLGGLALFVIGSIAAAFSNSFETLLIARFVQALGASAGSVAGRAVVSDTCDTQESARVFSILGQVMMLAPILAPMIGGLVLIYADWQVIFWVMAAIGAVSLLLTMRHLPETLAVEKRVPLSLVTIIHGYLRQLIQPGFFFYTMAIGATFGFIFIYVGSAPFAFIDSFNLSPTQFSFLFAANAATMIAMSQVNMRLLKRFSANQLLYAGLLAFVACGLALSAVIQWGQVNLWSYALLLALSIGTTGFITGNMFAATMASVKENAGTASALLGVMQFSIGGGLGYVVSLFTPHIIWLPLSFAVLGFAALVFCILGKQLTPADPA